MKSYQLASVSPRAWWWSAGASLCNPVSLAKPPEEPQLRHLAPSFMEVVSLTSLRSAVYRSPVLRISSQPQAAWGPAPCRTLPGFMVSLPPPLRTGGNVMSPSWRIRSLRTAQRALAWFRLPRSRAHGSPKDPPVAVSSQGRPSVPGAVCQGFDLRGFLQIFLDLVLLTLGLCRRAHPCGLWPQALQQPGLPGLSDQSKANLREGKMVCKMKVL